MEIKRALRILRAGTGRLGGRILVALAGATLLLAAPVSETVAAQDGVASYYGKHFHGRKTASGTRFNMHALTAAHKKWRFGTRVRVTNKANGKSVVVRINDRGPYVRGRTIDLSYGAARKLGMIGSGIVRVHLERLAGIGRTRSASYSPGKRKPLTVDDLF